MSEVVILLAYIEIILLSISAETLVGVLWKYPRFKRAVAVPRNVDVNPSRTCFQRFLAVTVSAVGCSRFGSGGMAVFPITKRLFKLRYRFFEHRLDILHTCNVCLA